MDILATGAARVQYEVRDASRFEGLAGLEVLLLSGISHLSRRVDRDRRLTSNLR